MSKQDKKVNYVEENSSDNNFHVGCIETVNVVDASEWYEGITDFSWTLVQSVMLCTFCVFNQLKIS